MTLQIIPVIGIGEITEGARLGPTLIETGFELFDDDVVVIASKVVAKAEGRVVRLTTDIADLVEAEAKRVLRRRGHLRITETHHGFVCANCGIDQSNVEAGYAVLLPVDPDNSAHVMRNELRGLSGVDVAVIVSDTTGRAWRNGITDVALGCAGLLPIDDLRGTHDAYGNELSITQVCVADEIAGAASLVMGKTHQIPVAVVRGLDHRHFGSGSIAADVTRRHGEDLFR